MSIFQAIANNDTVALEKLLANGENPNQKTEKNVTLLMIAAYVGNPKAVKLLLDAGALMNQRDDEENTPLMFALGEEHSEVVELLQKYNADDTIECPFCASSHVTVPPFPEIAKCHSYNTEFCVINGGIPLCHRCRSPMIPASKVEHFVDPVMKLLEKSHPAYSDKVRGVCPKCGYGFMLNPNLDGGGV